MRLMMESNSERLFLLDKTHTRILITALTIRTLHAEDARHTADERNDKQAHKRASHARTTGDSLYEESAHGVPLSFNREYSACSWAALSASPAARYARASIR